MKFFQLSQQSFNATMKMLLVGSCLFFTPMNIVSAQDEEGSGFMVKMCLFYDSPSGHARTDPIISNNAVSDHVHTFYGPQNFHPQTTNDDLRNTGAQFSSTPFVENQSLYWHPSIYEVDTVNGVQTYTRVSNLETSPYYRWDKQFDTEAFPSDFRMIAYSDQQNAGGGGESGGNLFIECCDLIGGEEEDCTSTAGALEFPQKNCDFVGIAFAMPTCWDGRSDSDDHKSHMAYTLNGEVAGSCPQSHPLRLPQIQLFVRINNYRGGEIDYILSDENNVFHVDFMNGWKDGVMETLLSDCQIDDPNYVGYNPACNCEQFLTENPNPSTAMCDVDVRELIADEATDIVTALPRGGGSVDLISKSWTTNPPLTCASPPPPDDDSPPDDDFCEDPTFTAKFVNRKGRVIKKTCEWVADRNTKGRCSFEHAASFCPDACAEFGGDCDIDATGPFKIPGRRGWKTCSGFVEDNLNRCDIPGVSDVCRATCSRR